LETEIPGLEDLLLGGLLGCYFLLGLRLGGPAERLEIVHIDRPLLGRHTRSCGSPQLGDLLVQGLDLGGVLPSHLAQLLCQLSKLMLELREFFLLRNRGGGLADGRGGEENQENGERCQSSCTHVDTSTQKRIDPQQMSGE
jgi:hypothetical protein